jgi:membrane protease YdiL (CAAX protease family)
MIPKIRFAVGLFILLAQLFLYINAEAIYGVYADLVRNVMLAYFILLAILSPFVIQILMKIGIDDIPSFSMVFILTALVMYLVPFITGITGEVERGLTLALGFGFLHGFVKAFNEEVIFRGVLPRMMGNKYGGIISSVAFGFFHLAVTGVNWLAMVFLSILGFVWYLIYQRYGIMGSTGSHFAYNLAALGVLPTLLGGG